MLTYRLGPEDGILSVRTQRSGAAAKAGHNLLIHVTSWEATVDLGEETKVVLEADGSSLRVQEGTGGMQALQDEDKKNIHQTIDDELTLLGETRPLGFDLAITGDGKLEASAVVKQTDWGMKPYSGLFGALKVVDEVEVRVEATLPEAQSL
jgi:hypothetical protein